MLEELPGVVGVSAVNAPPISGGDSTGTLTIEGRSFPPGQAPGASYRRILPDYFRVLGVPLLRGREFDEHDDGTTSVVIINEAMARQQFPDSDHRTADQGGAAGERALAHHRRGGG